MGVFRTRQHPNPFRVPDEEVAQGVARLDLRDGVSAQIVEAALRVNFRQQAARFEASVAVQVEVEAELVGVAKPVGDEHRGTGSIEQVGNVLVPLVGVERRAGNGVIVIDVCGIGKSGWDGPGVEPGGVDEVGRNHQAVFEFVGPGHHRRQGFDDGAIASGIGGQAGDGLVGGGGDRAVLAAADDQERDRHEGDDANQDQGDDEGDAALRVRSAECGARSLESAVRGPRGVMREAGCRILPSAFCILHSTFLLHW